MFNKDNIIAGIGSVVDLFLIGAGAHPPFCSTGLKHAINAQERDGADDLQKACCI